MTEKEQILNNNHNKINRSELSEKEAHEYFVNGDEMVSALDNYLKGIKVEDKGNLKGNKSKVYNLSNCKAFFEIARENNGSVKQVIKDAIQEITSCKIYKNLDELYLSEEFYKLNNFNVNNFSMSHARENMATINDNVFIDLLLKDKKIINASSFKLNKTEKNEEMNENKDMRCYKSDDNLLFMKHTVSKRVNKKNINAYKKLKFTRKRSVSFFVVPEGNIKESVSMLRYDNSDGSKHPNIFLEGLCDDNERVKIFGRYAKNPHFHFQNEDDNLICTKFTGNDKYAAASSNAIDIPHLIEYLKKIDALSEEELKKVKNSYGMPFVEIKRRGLENGKKSINFGSLEDFFSNCKALGDRSTRKLFNEIFRKYHKRFTSNWIESYSSNNKKTIYFANLIDKLEFLQYTCNQQMAIKNVKNNKTTKEKWALLIKMETLIVDDIIDDLTGINKETFKELYQSEL